MHICSAVSAVWGEKFSFHYNFIVLPLKNEKEAISARLKKTTPMRITEGQWRE